MVSEGELGVLEAIQRRGGEKKVKLVKEAKKPREGKAEE
jgi:hypothetical protein